MTEIMTKNRETKSLLAKLMASEDINVEYHEKASTAAFDTESRTLIMPVLKDMTENATDLFLGHEVGHALYTPQGAIKEVLKKGKLFKGLVNIVEDARIEKMIQGKFPGLKKAFYGGYGDMVKGGFFDLAGKDVNEANFVDRINIHFKVGTRAGVEFTDEEMTMVDRIANQKSFDDTLKISEELFDYIKENTEEEPEFDDDFNFGDDDSEPENNDGGMSSDMSMDFSDSDDSEDSDGDEEDGESSEGSAGDVEENTDTEEDSKTSASSDSDGDTDDPSEDTEDVRGNDPGGAGEHTNGTLPKAVEEALTSKTMESFEKALENHLDDSTDEYTYVNIPKTDIEKVLISMEEVHAELHSGVTSNAESNADTEVTDHISRNMKDWLKFRSENKSVVSYMAKEFEMRKSADEFKRTKVAKTGILNPNKLHAYKFSEDLFLRSNVVSEGKNHGFVMFIDWSGSMGENISHTIDQLMLIAMFCKKVNIPFDVFAFTSAFGSANGYYKFDGQSKGDVALGDEFKLMHLISSTVSTAKFNMSMMYLRWLRNGLSYRTWTNDVISGNLRLGGTPLNEAIVSAFEIVPMFQKKNKVQIVNTIFLTDGQGTPLRRYWDRNEDGELKLGESGYRGKYVLTDPVTKLHYNTKNTHGYDGGQSINLLEALADRTGTRVAGFYIAPMGRQFNNEVSWLAGGDYEKVAQMKDDLKKSSYTIVDGDLGYQQFFVLSDKHLKVEDVELEIDDDMTKGRMKNAFVKSRKNKIGNKAMLSKFCEFVA